MNDELVRFKLYLLQGKGAFDGKLVDRSPRTVEQHVSLLRRLMQQIPELSVVGISQHLLSLREKGRKGSYINDYVDVLQLYGRFKNTTEYQNLQQFPEVEEQAAMMSDEEIEAFLNLPPPTVTRRYKTGKTITLEFTSGWETWRMFWKIFAYHPIRPGGVAHLTVDDVDWGLEAFHFKDKTRKNGEIPIHPAIKEDLKTYLAGLETHQLFPSARGGQHRQGGVIDDVDWGYSFHNRIKRLGIKRKNIRPYSLRHSSLTRLLDAGVNPFLVMDMAGQKNLQTLLKYWHPSLKAKREAMKKDSLGKLMLPFYDKQKMFREQVFKLLESYANSPQEEKELIDGLKIF